MVLSSPFSNTISFGPPYYSSIQISPTFSSIYHASALPCHWSQSILSYIRSITSSLSTLSILSHIHSINLFLSIISIPSYHIQSNSSNSHQSNFIYPLIQSSFHSSNPFTSNQFQFYSNHFFILSSSSFQSHPHSFFYPP